MKKHIISLVALFLLFSCENNDDSLRDRYTRNYFEDTEISVNNFDGNFEVTLFAPQANSPIKLQSIIKSNNIQVATFTNTQGTNTLGVINQMYITDRETNDEAVMLFDQNGKPAFIYDVDLATGKKKESVIEFDLINEEQFFVRFYHYDWQNRLGTLLVELIITGSNGSYSSEVTFENYDYATNTKKSNKKLEKGDNGTPIPLARLELLRKKQNFKKNSQKLEELLSSWHESFDNFRNNTITDWLGTVRKAGAVATLAGLGVSGTILGAPAGAVLIVGGGALVLGSTVIEMFVSDKWSNYLNELETSITDFKETVINLAGNLTEVGDYSKDISDWFNETIEETTTTFEDLIQRLNENEIIIEDTDLDDLPDSNGVLQIGLSWNTSETDIDLWVTDPYGEKIYFAHRTSDSGGYLDRDDTDGFGPENVYWLSNIPIGGYSVHAHYYGCHAEVFKVTNYTIKITNGLGTNKVYTGTLSADGQVNFVTTFRFRNDEIIF